jgi:hypothetical protein
MILITLASSSGNKTTTGFSAFVVDPELADEVEVSVLLATW